MLRSLKELIGYSLEASDGRIGKIKDFLFDDKNWGIRYLVADTGKWLTGKLVIISPAAFRGGPDWASQSFPLLLSKSKIRNSPDLDEDQPVSRQKEAQLISYYGWPHYWGSAPLAPVDVPPIPRPIVEKREKPAGDAHLRSFKEVTAYSINASDGTIGHADDFILDDHLWGIRFIIIDTRNLLPGKKVLISPAWIKSFKWSTSQVSIDLSREKIKSSPVFDPGQPVNQAYEQKLYDYYGRPKN